MITSYILGHNVTFCYQRRELKSDANVLKLGGRESSILLLLLESPNTLLSKTFINDNVWGNILVAETSLTKAVSNIRKSLAHFPNISCELKTFPKQGYMLVTESDIRKSPSISDNDIYNKNEMLECTLASEMVHPRVESVNKYNTPFFGYSSLLQMTLIAFIASLITVFLEAIISKFHLF